MYVYKQTEFSPYQLFTVGYYEPNGNWISESDHDKREDAANRVAWLNGSRNSEEEIEEEIVEILKNHGWPDNPQPTQ